jgi:hypothetical protein
VAVTLEGHLVDQPARPLSHRVRMAILLCVLPLFGESFHLTTDIPPLYALAKMWAFLLLPLAVLGYARLRLPSRDLFVVALAYVVPIPPLMAMVYFGNTYLQSLTTIVKIVPITFYFSLSYVLYILKPTRDELQKTIIILGYTTFILMILFWIFVPKSSYQSYFGIQTIFVGGDDIRGDRIIMPMFFGVLLQLYLARRYQAEGRLRDLGLLFIFYVAMSIIYKERVPIIFSATVIGIGFIEHFMRSRAVALIFTGCAAIVAISLGVIFSSVDTVVDKFGGSLMVRIMTSRIAWDYLRDHPARWLFGAGGTTAYGGATIGEYFRNPSFYLADIGWLGVVFEYGLIGSGLILAVHIAGLRVSRARARDPFSKALADYAFYLFPASLIYSMALLPGEVATVTAMAVYFYRMARQDQPTRLI